MQTPLRITYHQMDSSEALNTLIREEVDKLESFFDCIIACRVAIEQPHRHHRQGKHFMVRVDLVVPNDEIVVGRDTPEHGEHEDARLAVSDAFRATARKLQDYVRRVRYQVKQHEEPPHGRVLRLENGYGFIESADGREIYFHANSVLEGGFAQLEVGTPVRFVEELGDKGPQASTVVPLRAGRAASAPQP